jgi:tripartite ATP-independent transporter DctM subunit
MKTKGKSLGTVLPIIIDKMSVMAATAAGLAMFLVALTTTYEVILRRIFDSPTTWVFSVSLFVMVWFALLAAPLGIKEGRQIIADFLVSRLSERTRAMLSVITYSISLIFLITLGFYGLDMCIDAYRKGITSIGLLLYPQWLLYLVFPVTTVLYCLQILRIIATEVSKLRRKQLTSKPGWQDDPRLVLTLFITLTAFGVYLVKVHHVAGIILLALCLMFGGVPVSFALGCSGIAGLFLIYQGFGSLSMVPVIVERTLYNFVLLAIPMFIMGGVILYKCGVGERTYDLASKWMSALPGGLAVGTVVACAIFSAMVGVSTAVAAAIGLTAIPILISRGYTKELAYGTVAGGALGVLIPPSAGLIVYGFLTNTSVGKLFAAAFIPGFIVVVLFAIYTVFYCVMSGKYEKVTVTWKERILSVKGAILGLSAPLIVLGGIYSGVFTPTEAAGVLVAYSMVVAFVYKKINWTNFIAIMRESAMLGSVIMMVMVGAMVLAHVIGHLRVARIFAEWIATAGTPHWMTLTGIALLYVILGMFLDGLSITVLTVPVLYPLMPVLGVDVVVFGVVLMIFIEMALLTPPVGLNLFMVKAITGDSLWPVVKGNLPFAALLMLGAIILLLFPQLALWLPKILGV